MRVQLITATQLQQKLNQEVFTDNLTDFARQPDQHIALINSLMSQGRQELIANSRFNKPLEHDLVPIQLSWTVERYIDFQRSQANGDLISNTVVDQIRASLGNKSLIQIDNHVGITIARK